jgi:xanthine dehydrogenase YagR molybdenum-binding subunit
MPTTPETSTLSPIGRPTLRIDGPQKVTGTAQYTSDFNFPGTLYAVPVEATIANGRLVRLDTAAAERMPGVRAVLHRGNIGPIYRSTLGPGFEGIVDERRPPFDDDFILYYGQYIACAVADSAWPSAAPGATSGRRPPCAAPAPCPASTPPSRR